MQQSIRIHVAQGRKGLLIATSPDLPRFQVIGLSMNELKQEVPAALRAIRRLSGEADLDQPVAFAPH